MFESQTPLSTKQEYYIFNCNVCCSEFECVYGKVYAFKETGKHVSQKGNNIFFLDLVASKLFSCRKPCYLAVDTQPK